MKEPDINLIREALNIPVKDKFMGYLIFNNSHGDFLLSCEDSKAARSFKWTLMPEKAICFDSYLEAFNFMKRFHLNYKAIILMGFDFGSGIGTTEIPESFLKY